MNDADASSPCKGDSHRRLGNGVHCSGYDRNVKGDVAAEAPLKADLPGKDLGVRRNEQYIIEGEALHYDTIIFVHILAKVR